MKMLARLCIAFALTVAASLSGAADLPPVSHDGLHLVPGTKVRAVYMKPGADLSQFDKIALLKTYVAFRKNWKRAHNEEVPLSERVDDKEMQKIREYLATEFEKIFTEVLSTKGGHTVVTQGADGVLIIRPAIINLDVTAPDTMSAGISRTFTASSGSMTLYMELYDGKTGDIIARVIDPEAVGDDMIQWSNSVTNKAEADRVLRRWATLLNEHLAAVSSIHPGQ